MIEFNKESARNNFYQKNPTHSTYSFEEKRRIKEEKLDKRRKLIQKYRNRKYSLAKIGEKLGVTRERARQIEIALGFPPRQVEWILEKLPLKKSKCRLCKRNFSYYGGRPDAKFCNMDCFKKYKFLHRMFHSPQEKRDYARKRMRKYYKTKKGKAIIKKIMKISNLKNKDKLMARSLLNRAVKSCRIIRPKKCTKCGQSKLRITGHHPDYTKPLKVKWLCDYCHHQLHKKMKENGTKH